MSGNTLDWSAVTEWFGHVPRFHDCEVVSIILRRDPEPSEICIHAFVMTPETDARGYFITEKHALVTFTLTYVLDLDFEGWNHQNALESITTEPVDNGHCLIFEPAHGVGGEITAMSIIISLHPVAQEDIDKTLVAVRAV
jgi:hypothetical protein